MRKNIWDVYIHGMHVYIHGMHRFWDLYIKGMGGTWKGWEVGRVRRLGIEHLGSEQVCLKFMEELMLNMVPRNSISSFAKNSMNGSQRCFYISIIVKDGSSTIDLCGFDIMSFNVRGIQNLQETHGTAKDENLWKNQWGGDIYFSHGASNARGTMILVEPKLDFKLLDLEHDDQGRYMSMTCKIQELQLKIINVYAPTTESVKKSHIKILQIFDPN
jgi:hypothetical protein